MGPGNILPLLLLALSLPVITSHPQCTDSYPPFEDANVRFCSRYREFGCCVAERDAELEDLANSIWAEAINEIDAGCWYFILDILCQECSPYAAHMFNIEGSSKDDWTDFPGLCTDYCHDFHDNCSYIVPYLTRDRALLTASAESTEAFCEAQQIDDVDYCFPSVMNNDDFNDDVRAGKIGSGDECLCLEEFANGLRNPLSLTFANDGTHRIYIAEQSGVISVYLRNGSYLNEPFLDIQDLVYVTQRTGDERGLLGLAFHPDYVNNRKFYVHYTTRIDGELYVRVSELRSFANDTNRADPRTERVLIEVEQPAGNHNGGTIFFAPDGYFYISLGDGGIAGDPFGEYGNGLNLTAILGKILRVDVDRRDGFLPYGIPADNPFVNEDPDVAFHEIFAYGIRNMWRCSVDRGDRETGNGAGRIFCGDVGQNKYEEIDILVNGGNYGWRAREGDSCYDRDLCNPEFLGDNYVGPIHVYPHSVGKSVTGGYVYRGCLYPHLQGLYIYGDFYNGRLFKLDDSSGEWVNTEICLGTKDICTGDLWNYFPENILSFGEDDAGELYMLVTDVASSTHDGGKVFRFVDPNKQQYSHTSIPVPNTTHRQPSLHVHPAVLPREPHHVQYDPLTTELSNCPNRCSSNFGSLTKRKFCRSYYAIVGTVESMTNYNAGMRVALSNVHVLRKKSYLRSLKSDEELTLEREAAICSCPDLKVGKRYFIMGSYRFGGGGQLIVKMRSIVKEYHWYYELSFAQWLNSKECRKK